MRRVDGDGYDEWGIPNAANQGRFQYTGQTWLGELGMYHYKARIYSPTLSGSNPRPMYVIHGDRVGVRELVDGRLQFRMVSGTTTLEERRHVQQDLNQEQRMFRR